MEAEETYNESYKCGECGTMSVSSELEWDRIGYEESLFWVYTCKKCGGTLALDSDSKRNSKREGDTIYVERKY